MLDPYYSTWYAEKQVGEFPTITGWQEIEVSDKEAKYIGVSESKEHALGYPSIFLDFSPVTDSVCQIQNTSKQIAENAI